MSGISTKIHKIFKDYLRDKLPKHFPPLEGKKEPLYLVAYFQGKHALYSYPYKKHWVIEVFSDLSKAKEAIIDAKRNSLETHIWKIGDEMPFKYTKDKVVWKTK